MAVLGDTFLSGNVYGIQRYAYEILKQLDTIVKDIHIEIIVPEHFDVDCSFKNIKIVKFGKLKNLFYGGKYVSHIILLNTKDLDWT